MVSLITPAKAQKNIAEHTRARRLQMGLTQEGLAERSGVALSTLRKFEQKGSISLESFLKLQMVLGKLNDILHAAETSHSLFSSIDDVLNPADTPRQRGSRK